MSSRTSTEAVNTGDGPGEPAEGYTPQFERTLGRFQSFAIGFSFISVTTGLFSTYGTVLGSSGPAGIWTWPIVAIGTLCVALVYGMLASRIPLSGYSYQWASRLSSPVLGWWFGWLNYIFLAMVTVAVDYSFTQVALFPLFNITYTNTRGALVTILVFLVQATLIVWSTPIVTKLNDLAVGAEVIAIVGLTLLIGAVVIFGGKGQWSNVGSYGVVSGHGYFGWLGPFMLSALLGAFTLVGWEAAANLAEETKNPKQVIPRAMVRAVGISGGIGMLFLIAITAAIGKNVTALTSDSAPVATIIASTLGDAVAKVTLVVVCAAIFCCGLVIMTSNSRLIHAMARDGRLPASRHLSMVPRATGGPTWATVVAGGTALLIVVSFSSNADVLSQLLGAGTILPAILYAATVALYIFTRRRYVPEPGDFRLGKWEIPVVAVAVIWLVLELCIFLIPAEFRAAQGYVLVTVGIGAVLFCWLWLTRRDSLRAVR